MYGTRGFLLISFFTLGIAAVSCGGRIGEGTQDNTPGTPGSDAGGTTPSTSSIPAPLRRLTRTEYNNTVRDLLHVTMTPADDFVPDEVTAVFSNNAATQIVSPLLAEQYMLAGEKLAAAATADLPTLLGCSPAGDKERACVTAFIPRFGLRAFRRPLLDTETARFLALYDEARKGTNTAGAVGTVIAAALQSPHFLYRPELGVSGGALSSYEIATRISYFLWQTMPDDALFAAASSGALLKRAEIEAHARRLLRDPRAQATVRLFHDEWLGLTDLGTVEKDPVVFPEFKTRTRGAMAAEAHEFVDDVIWKGDGRLETLLTASYTFLSPPLAPIYGLPVPTAVTRVDLDPKQRAGLLTLPGLLALNADEDDQTPRAPIVRGRLVLDRLLCQPIGDPPADVPDPPERDPMATRRQQLADHRADPACASCHNLLDPVGLGFEHYDAIGRYVTMEAGKPVDASGSISGTSDANGDFVGAVELARRLGKSDHVRDCVTAQMFRFAFGRFEGDADKPSLAAARASFATRDFDLKELLVGLTLTESFAHREPVKETKP